MLDLLSPQSRLDTRLLQRPGGWAWWYLDLVDEKGDGLVLIWAFGLPFLPGQGVASERPSIALSVYRDGQSEFVLLTEVEEAEVLPTGWRFDDCWFHQWSDGERDGLDVVLDLPTVKGRLQGTLSVDGPRLVGSGSSGAHGWTPMMGAGDGWAAMRCADWEIELKGRAYRDRNEGDTPLDALGIRSWTWGRTSLDGRLVCWYLVDGEHPSARLVRETDGRLEVVEVEVEEQDWQRDRYGLRWARRLTLVSPDGQTLHVEQRPPVDRSPFYLRQPVVVNGQAGWGETVCPSKLDLWWMRPLVEMRIQRLGANSPFLSWFSGPRPPLRWV